MASSTTDFCWGIEPNPRLCAVLRQRFAGQPVEILEYAAWISAGTMPLYLGDPVSSTLLEGKVTLENYPQFAITYDESVAVQTLDTAQWLNDHVTNDDAVIVKMDIEGAEYQVLRHLLDSGAIELINELRCEFHAERFPASAGDHDRIVAEVGARTKLVIWR
ncbi:FkbM family methyltransferase [Devosia rhodophyticola]